MQREHLTERHINQVTLIEDRAAGGTITRSAEWYLAWPAKEPLADFYFASARIDLNVNLVCLTCCTYIRKEEQ